jgi:hypothetical protein
LELIRIGWSGFDIWAPNAALIKLNADDPVVAGMTGASPAPTIAPPPINICRLVRLLMR